MESTEVLVSVPFTSNEMSRRGLIQLLLIVLTFVGEMHAKQDWEPCGLPSGCYCSRPILSQIHCTNISVLPLFKDLVKPGVISLAVYDSNIVGIPPFKKEEWDRLKYLSFIGTPLLMCDAIAAIKRPGLEILSKCLCPPEKECPVHASAAPNTTDGECPQNKGRTICLATLLAFIFLIVLAMGVIHALLLHESTIVVPVRRVTRGQV